MFDIINTKSVKVILITFLVYGGLVAAHEGEFWPLSIYPMFSQGANPWTRAMVKDVRQLDDETIWQVSYFRNTPGTQVAMQDHGIDQIDFSNFVSKTTHWDEQRVQGLRTMMGPELLASKDLMIYKVNGIIHDDGSIDIEAVPFILLTENESVKNPNLPQSAFFRD